MIIKVFIFVSRLHLYSNALRAFKSQFLEQLFLRHLVEENNIHPTWNDNMAFGSKLLSSASEEISGQIVVPWGQDMPNWLIPGQHQLSA